MIKQKEATTFHVAIKNTLPDGSNVTSFIGGAMYSRFQLKKALKRIQRTTPEVFGGRFVAYY